MNFNKLLLASVFALTLFPVSAMAGSSEGTNINKRTFVHACRRFKTLIRNIHLTDEQKTQVADLLVAYRADAEQYGPELFEAKKELFIVVHKPKELVDQDEVRSAFQSVAAIDEELIVLRTEFWHDLNQLVEPWQYVRLVKAEVNLRLCLQAPYRIYRKHLDDWIGEHQSSGGDV